MTIRVESPVFERVQKAAEEQGISQSKIARQTLFFGLSDEDYHRVLDIANHEGVEPKMIIRQSFSLSDMLMNPNTTVSDVLVSFDPNMPFAKAMRSRPNLLARLFSKVFGKAEKKLKKIIKEKNSQ